MGRRLDHNCILTEPANDIIAIYNHILCIGGFLYVNNRFVIKKYV